MGRFLRFARFSWFYQSVIVPNIKGLIRGTIYSKEHQLQFGKIYLLFVLEVKEETSDRSTFKQWHGWHILYLIAICFAKHIVIELLREYIITTHWMHYQSISKLKVAATDREKTRYIRSSRKFFGFHAKLLFCRGKQEPPLPLLFKVIYSIMSFDLPPVYQKGERIVKTFRHW